MSLTLGNGQKFVIATVEKLAFATVLHEGP
jgi:hypothetical protein